ncbi:MAG TPA: ATP-binding protein [Streptosporangiaceae bacterium]|nr:ATP-binding protein [Streptosporangiaceae bacterium]
MKFSLALPREALSIPVIRRVLGDALRGLGVSEDCVSDILLATCEACTNVVKHARATACYEVLASVDDEKCVLKIVETGRGPQRPEYPDRLPLLPEGFPRGRHRRETQSRLEAESGRGINIMRALVDDVTFDTASDSGTIVYLQKRLTWRDEALLRRLEYDLVHSGN